MYQMQACVATCTLKAYLYIIAHCRGDDRQTETLPSRAAKWKLSTQAMHVSVGHEARRSYDVVAVSKQDYKEGHRLLDQTPNSVFGLLRQMLVSQSMRIYLLVV
jgi:hypothetical protein